MQRVVSALGLLALLAGSVACSGDGGGGGGGSGGRGAGGQGTPSGGNGATPGASSSSMLSLEQACEASCNAQAATNCPGVFPPGECTNDCIGIASQFPNCAGPWKDLNACTATAPLTCDRVNGGAAVSSKDCGPQIDAFTKCGP